MTERRGDSGFSVAPRRLGDGPPGRGPRRVRRFGIAIVATAAIVIVTIAFLGPRLSDRPNLDLSFFATPTPGATASPSASARATPTAQLRPTPLPEITRADGSSATGRVAIGVDGIRVLDLADGTIEKAADTIFGRDAVVRAPDGAGWTCVCFVDDIVEERPVRITRIIGIDPTGLQTDSANVLTLPASFNENGSADPATDVDVTTDGRNGLLAIASRVGPAWQFSVAGLDLDGRRLGPMITLGLGSLPATGPTPSPRPSVAPARPSAGQTPGSMPIDVYLDGPHVRMAPGGRVAFVWGVIQGTFDGDTTTTAVRAWRVAIGQDGSVDEVAPATAFDELPPFCGAIGFAAADRLASLCPLPPADPSSGLAGTWQLATFDLDGRAAGVTEILANNESYFSEPLFDRANGEIHLWDPMQLKLVRIDAHTLAQESVTIDPAAGAAPGVPAGGGPATPDWRDADSAVQMLPFSQIAAAPDGSRIYLLGFAPVTSSEAIGQASLGVFVVDRSTLALVDRWAPAAGYVGISVMPDGLVLATGNPGMDDQGREAPWQASLTVHDPADGRILVRFGRLGQDSPLFVFDR